MTRTDEQLTEARQLVRNLQRIEPKNAGDARFIQTWAEYLDRAGDRAAIGRFRLHNLRTVAASYGLCEKPQGIQPAGWIDSARGRLNAKERHSTNE